uniref:Uncharacterized protein n=1 Tax=Anguilla anguilla TaxID=7936 RepID=A0A0E9VW08_ANGAN
MISLCAMICTALTRCLLKHLHVYERHSKRLSLHMDSAVSELYTVTNYIKGTLH